MKIQPSITQALKRMVNNMSKVFKLIIVDGNEPVILEEDKVLEDILNHLESISNRIDDIQFSLIKKDDKDSSSDLDISEIDF